MTAPATPIEVAGYEVWGEPPQNLRCIVCNAWLWLENRERNQIGFQAAADQHRKARHG